MKLNFCVSIFLALVITELPLIPNYFNIFSLRFTVLYPLVFRYFFSVSITLFYCFHFIFPSFFFFIFFSSTPPQFFSLTTRIFHPSSVIRRYAVPDLLTPLNVYGCHGCLNMQISKSLVHDMFAWPDNLIWLPYQLWLTDDCLLRIVSCIDDPTSFYNIALTNRRLLQVTKRAKSAHHKNLLLLKAEYFIKCLVVESGDDSKLRWLTTVCFVLFCFVLFCFFFSIQSRQTANYSSC